MKTQFHTLAGMVIAAVTLALPIGQANACDACNLTFADEILTGERSESLIAKDLRRAMENQKSLPIKGFSNRMLIELQEAKLGVPGRTELVSGPAPRPAASTVAVAANAAAATPAAETTRAVPEYMKKADFIEIIERDYALKTTPYSTVPQDAPHDKSFTIRLHEGKTYIGNGVVYEGFLIDGKIPGPTLMVDEGDVVEFNVVNDGMLTHAVGSASRGAIGLLVVDDEAELKPHRSVLADGPEFSKDELETYVAEAKRVISPFGVGTHPVDSPVRFRGEVKEVTVSIIGNSYHPKVVEIAPGTKVTWSNEDVFTYLGGEFSGIHNAVAIKMPEGATGFVTPLLAHAESGSHVFETPGEYEYICAPHPYMKGKIIVREPSE